MSPIYVYGDEIVPSASDDFWSRAYYTVTIRHEGCPAIVGQGLSSQTWMARWGDITGGWDGSSWTGPDGTVDQTDIDAVVAKFQNLPGAPIKARADVAVDVPDRIVSFIDIGHVTNATQGSLYPFDGPTGCPP